MKKIKNHRFPLIAITVIFLFLTTISIVSAHSLGTMGGAQWVISKNNIHISMEFAPDLLNTLKGVQEKYQRIDSCSAGQLQRIAMEVFKPYLDQKLLVWINGRKFPITVCKLTKDKGYLYNLTLLIQNIRPVLKKGNNFIKIDYRLFFEETDGAHINMTTIRSADSDDTEIQNQFTVDSPVWEEPIEIE